MARALESRFETTIICNAIPPEGPPDPMAYFTPISDYIDKDDAAGRVASQAALLLRLRESASLVIPAALLRSASIANFKQGKVVIFAENNAIAAKLRLFEPRMIDVWARQGVQVSSIRCEVQPGRAGGLAPQKGARLSPAAADALGALEAGLPADSPLREAVGALTRRARKG